MTDRFEVHDRDGAARLGELRLADPLTTPALADDVLADAGSLWVDDRAAEGDESRLTVLPHRGFPAGTPGEVQDAFAVDYPDVDYPSAATVTARTVADHGADAYVLAGAPGLVGDAGAFVEAVVAVREAVPPDTALVLSGVATPRNVALLAYAGVDLVDADRAVVRGTQGRYLTTDGAYDLAELAELPCACPVCADSSPGELSPEACAEHNERALSAQLRRVRERIRRGRLRDYLEGQVRHEPWLTAAFRRLDDRWGYLEQRTPVVRQARMDATTEDALRRVEIRRFADRVTGRYRPRFTDAPLLLVPCSARKPYSQSRSHRAFQDAAGYRAHLVSMTSPIGVVPRELELTYPAQHYDAAVTGRWTAGERDFVAEVLARYLRGTDYPRIVAHLPEEYVPVVEAALEDVEAPDPEFTVVDHPTDDDSLANLAGALEGERTIPVSEHERTTVRAVADYQFGAGAGDDLLGGFDLRGRYPKSRAFDGEEQLAALVPQYGMLALTLAGGRRWIESDLPVRRVDIDGFVPEGSVLAPGVLDASESVRVGDEVVVEGPAAFAVGRAAMSGPEMARSTRGVAVEVRHCERK